MPSIARWICHLLRRGPITLVPGIAMVCLALSSAPARAAVPIHFSVKFILDGNGSRPLMGGINTDGEVRNQIDRSNQILDAMGSEFEFEVVEIVDLAGVSQWFMTPFDGDTLDGIRDAARDDPALYAWRTDAINVYVNGSGSSGIAYLPQNSGWVDNVNDIFLLGQGLRATTFLHESGHVLSNVHTHESGCTGLDDDPSWSRTEVAENNFGSGPLSPEQDAQVDDVFYSVMSYHSTRDRFAPCQLDGHSGQASYGVHGLMPRGIFYVDGVNGEDDGYASFSKPLRSLDPVSDYPEWLTRDGYVVLLNHTSLTVPLATPGLTIVPRQGAKQIHQDNQLWVLPTAESEVFPPPVRALFHTARALERAGDRPGVRRVLAMALERTTGAAKVAIHLELAQRFEDDGDCGNARSHYGHVAELTLQDELRRHAAERATACSGDQSGRP